MAAEPPTTQAHVERPGPAEFRDPLVRRELQRAAVEIVVVAVVRRRDAAEEQRVDAVAAEPQADPADEPWVEDRA